MFYSLPEFKHSLQNRLYIVEKNRLISGSAENITTKASIEEKIVLISAKMVDNNFTQKTGYLVKRDIFSIPPRK